MDNPSVTANNLSGAAGGIGTIFSLIGNMKNASAAENAGKSQQQAANFAAAQLDQNAGQAVAAAQRDAANERLKTALLVSRGVAVAAAGGGATTDPTVAKLLSDISAAGEYRAGVALYEGEEKARQARMQASAQRYEGDMAAAGGSQRAAAYRMAGLGQAIVGGASLFSKYGQGGPKKNAQSGTFGGGWSDAGSTMDPTLS